MGMHDRATTTAERLGIAGCVLLSLVTLASFIVACTVPVYECDAASATNPCYHNATCVAGWCDCAAVGAPSNPLCADSSPAFGWIPWTLLWFLIMIVLLIFYALGLMFGFAPDLMEGTPYHTKLENRVAALEAWRSSRHSKA